MKRDALLQRHLARLQRLYEAKQPDFTVSGGKEWIRRYCRATMDAINRSLRRYLATL